MTGTVATCTYCEAARRAECADHEWDPSGFTTTYSRDAKLRRLDLDRAASVDGKRAAGALTYGADGKALYNKYPMITVHCPGCGVDFETTSAPSMRRQFCSQACSARTATRRHEGTFEAAPAMSRAERLAAAAARNPEMARRYGVKA